MDGHGNCRTPRNAGSIGGFQKNRADHLCGQAGGRCRASLRSSRSHQHVHVSTKNQSATMNMNDISEFFSWTWFTPETFQSYDWENLWALHLLWLIPLLFLMRKFVKFLKNPVLELSIPKIVSKSNPWTYLRLVPGLFFILTLLMIIIALARPQRSNEKVE